jgi:putative endonuclease
MKHREALVFVEVRTRKNPDYASAVESITPSKQGKLIKTALYYLQQHDLMDKIDCRFDVIGQDQGQKFYWIQNALEVQY